MDRHPSATNLHHVYLSRALIIIIYIALANLNLDGILALQTEHGVSEGVVGSAGHDRLWTMVFGRIIVFRAPAGQRQLTQLKLIAFVGSDVTPCRTEDLQTEVLAEGVVGYIEVICLTVEGSHFTVGGFHQCCPFIVLIGFAKQAHGLGVTTVVNLRVVTGGQVERLEAEWCVGVEFYPPP